MYLNFVLISAPKLKGRPRKRKNNIRAARTGSPAESEASSESSTSTSISISAPKVYNTCAMYRKCYTSHVLNLYELPIVLCYKYNAISTIPFHSTLPQFHADSVDSLPCYSLSFDICPENFLFPAIIKERHEEGFISNIKSEKHRKQGKARGIGLFEKTDFIHGKEKYAN